MVGQVRTDYRVLDDSGDPSLGTLREIAFACGRSLSLDTRPLADPAAAAAARAELERDYVPNLPGVEQWRERLHRRVAAQQVNRNHIVALAQEAGKASAPLLRSDTVLLRGPVTFGRVASAGHASEQPWAISGLAGFQHPGLWETTPAPTILWTPDPRHVQQLLADADLQATSRWQRAHVAICLAEPALFANSVEHAQVHYASPLQIVMDGFSIGGVAESLARRQIDSW